MARPLDQSTTRRQRPERASSYPPFVARSTRDVDSQPAREPGLVDDDVPRPDDVSIDEVVERLSRDISDAVNRAPLEERDELRTYASEIVREDTAPPGIAARPPAARHARLSFFAVAVWL